MTSRYDVNKKHKQGGKGRREFTFTGKNLQKNKKLPARIPKSKKDHIKEKIENHGLKGFQDLFDCLIISGVVFRDSQVIDFVKEKIPEYKEKATQEKLSRFGKAERPKNLPTTKESVTQVFYMYDQDFRAFKEFLVEMNVKQNWLFFMLFLDGFYDEDERVLQLVNKYKDRNVNKRKKAVARLTNDSYITTLPESEAQKILDQATKLYDERQFDDDIQEYIYHVLEARKKESEEEEEIENKLSSKIEKLKKQKNKELKKVEKPVEE